MPCTSASCCQHGKIRYESWWRVGGNFKKITLKNIAKKPLFKFEKWSKSYFNI